MNREIRSVGNQDAIGSVKSTITGCAGGVE